MDDKEKYIEKLEQIAEVHIHKHPAHILDNKILAYDREKMIPFIRGPKVLELGCGDGDWTPRMIQLFGHSYAVEASSKLAAHVRSLYGENVTVYNSLFEEFMPPEKYNTIIAAHVLEHVNDPVLILRRCREWLAPDGVIIILVPNANSIHRQLAVRMGIQKTIYDPSPRDIEMGHQRVYDAPKLRADIAAAGLMTVFELGLFLKVLPNAMMLDFSDDLLKALSDIASIMPMEYMANLAFVVRAA